MRKPLELVDLMRWRSVQLVVVSLILTVAVITVQLAMPMYVLETPQRSQMGRPRVHTARHLPPPSSDINVRYHRNYYAAYLRGLNISSPAQLPAAALRHPVLIGVGDQSCDDGRANVTRDWEDGAAPHLCPAMQRLDVPTPLAARVDCQGLLSDNIPTAHVCMNASVTYGDGIPSYGHHRPLWPIYGSYRFLPPQRWLHSIEHGAVVLLHHPCVDPSQLRRLRSLVVRCIRKHVVTPSRRVDRRRPLALVTHGCVFQMARVSVELVVAFIRAHAMHGKQGHMADEGQFKDQLLRPAGVPVGSDFNDTMLCPFYPKPTASDTLFYGPL